ncbi:unnamed protein product [Trichobilharzia regenti]|nr:unnamed protein product [Trichobilharzia regenti]
MRHRGPTTTSDLSSSLYMDKHCGETQPMLVGDSTKSDVHPAANGLYNNTSGVSTSKASRIPSAALSRMHSSSNANNCFSHPNRVQRQDFKSKLPSQPTTGLMNTSQQEKTTTSNKSGRYMNQRKLRKKGGSGSKRETRFQMNGSTDQNLHSLKVTIRRTYNSSELENGVCAIVNTPEENTNSNNTTNNNGNNHESLHRLYTPVNSIQPEHCDPQHLNGKLNTKDLYNLVSQSFMCK